MKSVEPLLSVRPTSYWLLYHTSVALIRISSANAIGSSSSGLAARGMNGMTIIARILRYHYRFWSRIQPHPVA